MIQADWSMCGTMEKLRKAIGSQWLSIGWTETETDTLLILENPSIKSPQYTMYVWNRPGVRASLAELLGLPVISHRVCKEYDVKKVNKR